MSSLKVREAFLGVAEEILPNQVMDLTGIFDELEKDLEAYNINTNKTWVGVQFLPEVEVPVDIGSTNSRGSFRETGIVNFYITTVARLGVHKLLLEKAELFTGKLRGSRIGTDKAVVVEAVTPAIFGKGATLDFEGGYISCLVRADYYYDNLRK